VLGRKPGTSTEEKHVDMDLAANAFAKAVHEGDIVNLQFLFGPFSPARSTSPERFETEKYSYLTPDEDQQRDRDFRETLDLVRSRDIWAHIENELTMTRRPQLPYEMVLRLADNAFRLGKYTSAAQAYEMLRIRGRMQELVLEQADDFLDKGNIKKAVQGYVAASGLEYDYAAFPEPLPKTPDYQMRALVLHGDYPERPEDCLPMQETPVFVQTALGYLLMNNDLAARLEPRPLETRIAFLKKLVDLHDPAWREFVHRYREALELRRDFAERIQRAIAARTGEGEEARKSLAGEIDETLGADPGRIPAVLLGRELENAEWWQYLKELAYVHPAAILFVSRQFIGDQETIMPLYREGSPVVKALGLIPETAN
jgi:tetratricopeptide (TPR) repeat protein